MKEPYSASDFVPVISGAIARMIRSLLFALQLTRASWLNLLPGGRNADKI